MTILYPINKPVSAGDVAARAVELLARAGEWTRWETVVLETLRDRAEDVHAHYMRHVWFELEGLGQPDAQAARDGVLAGAGAMLGLVVAEDAAYAMAMLTVRGDGDPDGALGLLLVHAARMVDAVMEGLRRGPCVIQDEEAHGVDMATWEGILRFDDPDASPPDAWNARSTLRDGMRTLVDNIAADELSAVRDALSRRAERSLERNGARMTAVAQAANAHYGIPQGYELAILEIQRSQATISWGDRDVAAGSMRPHGEQTLVLENDVMGEVRPHAVSEVARLGRQLAMTLGRDAEVVAGGHDLASPPIWSWAGPLPVVRHIVAMLAAGHDVDVSRSGMGVGPLLGVADVPLGGSASYSYDARTLDEWIRIDRRIDDALAYACVGNPVSVIVAGPLLEGPDVTIASCDASEDGTELEILSPVVRLRPAPEGMEQDPQAAWLSALEDFDDEAVYGPRPLGRAPTVS